MIVDVIVAVIAPVIVAALVNGNDAVVVIDAGQARNLRRCGPISLACGTSRSSMSISAPSSSSRWLTASLDNYPGATRAWPISYDGPGSRFRRTSPKAAAYYAGGQGEALYDRQRVSDGMCFAPRRHEDR